MPNAQKFRFALSVALVCCLAASCGSDDTAKSSPADAGAAGEPDDSGGRGGSSVGGSNDRAGTSSGGESGGEASASGSGGDTAIAGAASGGAAGETGSAGAPQQAAGAGGEGVVEASCEDFNPGPPATQPVIVRFQNDTASNIYLGSPSPTCVFEFGFEVLQGDSELQPARDFCDATCGDLQEDTCDCEPVCVPIVTLVAPGKKFDVGWPATVFTSRAMPASCYFDGACSAASCLVEESVPAGPLTIRGSAYADKECDSGQCFDCTAGASGSCIVSGAQRTKGGAMVQEATWNGENLVTLTFSPPDP